jgi:Raf kinase inhibitor-like YbhB/YbcL family protein
MALRMTSDAFEDGGIVSMRYSCFGDNVQPGFRFADPPRGTTSYAIVFHDIDVALDGTVEDGLHWVVWNIPVDAGGIPENGLPAGAVVGRNVENKNAYLGPGAPPGQRYHHYVFELYALDRMLELPSTASRAELLRAMDGCTTGKAAYVGRFHRPG